MNKNIIATTIAAATLIGGAYVAPIAVNETRLALTPDHLRLKAPAEKVLADVVREEYTEFDKETGEPIEDSKREIVYYAYRTDREVETQPNEIVEKRTFNTYTQRIDGDKFVQTSTAGQKFVMDTDTGQWFYTDYATTTPEVFQLEAERMGYVANVAWAADTGFVFGGTFANVNFSGDANCGNGTAWTTTSNAGADDNAYAQWGNTGSATQCLRATNFGFSITDGATIDGVQAQIGAAEASSGNCATSIIHLVKGGTSAGSNMSDSYNGWSTTEEQRQYGGASNLWGTTVSEAEVEDSAFGWQYSASKASFCQFNIDYMQLKVFYTAGGGGGAAPVYQPIFYNSDE